jgi:hypothetical protein
LQQACALAQECIIPIEKEYAGPDAPALPNNFICVVGHILEKGGGAFRKSMLQLKATIDRYGPIPRVYAPPLQRVWATIPEYEIEADWIIEQEVPLISFGTATAETILGRPLIGPLPAAYMEKGYA